MKSKQKSVQFLYRIVMTVLLLNWIIPVAYSSEDQEEKQEIEWIDCNWLQEPTKKVDKSFSYFPITAYVESSVLYIQNDKPNGAINIAIVSQKSGHVVWEQVVPESATSLVVIPLEALSAGEYTLQLVNEWGGYLYGSFRK